MPHAVIIDDQISNADVLAMLLDREGFSHTIITRHAEAVPTVRDLDHFDVIFLDLEFPNADFYSLLYDLKALPEVTGVPVIAYTVHISEISQARSAGFDGFLGKPLRIREFPQHLARIMGGEPVWVY